MRFPLPILATTTVGLLSTLSNAAPITCDSLIGAGIGIDLGSPIQVKAGDSRDPARQCPAGWTRSVLSVDLCIEIGGREHHREHHKKKPKKQHKQEENDEKEIKKKKKKQKQKQKQKEKEQKQREKEQRKKKKKPQAQTNRKCLEGQRAHGSLLDVCIDIDTDPLYLGGGIKIGLGKDHSNNLPPCKKNDPLALLNLCVAVGLGGDPLLGAGIKLGGGDDDPLFGGGGIKIAKHNNDDDGIDKHKKKKRPACDGKDDPRALLDLCVVFGSQENPLVKAKAKVGGGDDGLFGNGGIKVALGVGSDPDGKKKGKKGGKHHDEDLIDAKVKVGDSAPIKAKVEDDLGVKVDVPGLLKVDTTGDNDRTNSDRPLLDLSGLLSVKVGGDSAPQGEHHKKPSTPKKNVANVNKPKKQTAPVSSPKCGAGYILNAGICIKIKADVKVGNIVHAKADAKVGV